MNNYHKHTHMPTHTHMHTPIGNMGQNDNGEYIANYVPSAQ